MSFNAAGKAKMRIALLLPRFSRYGGVEQFGYRLASQLAEKGYAVDFICARQEEPAMPGVNVIALGRPPWGKVLKLLWFTVRAELFCRKQKYDFVISLGKSWHQDLTRMGGGPLRLFWEKSEQSLPPGWPRWCKRVSRLLSPSNWLILFIENHQFTASSRVIAVSHLVRQWLLQAHPKLDPAHVSVVYNKPDLSRFSVPDAAQKAQARQRAAVLAGVGSFEKGVVLIGTASTNFVLKGVGPLIRAVACLPSHCHLLVAGGRDARKYRQLAAQLGVRERVHFLGRVDDMPLLYQALDIFILPTFYDACSNAVLEALASGCKTITSRANGAAYFLPAQDVLENPGSVDEISAVLQHKLNQPAPEVFVWPEDVACGIDAFVSAFEGQLAAKGR